MQSLLRALFRNCLILYFAYLLYPGIIFDGHLYTLLMAGITLTILNRFIKPILKLLLLPINLITLGVFRWLINVITLFILSLVVSGYHLAAYQFVGFTYQGFVAPPLYLNLFFSFVVASTIITLLGNLIKWLL